MEELERRQALKPIKINLLPLAEKLKKLTYHLEEAQKIMNDINNLDIKELIQKDECHRFYYSAKQDNLKKVFDYNGNKKNFIKLYDGSLARYSQWCRIPGLKCLWDDAVLVAEIYASEKDILERIVVKEDGI